MNLEIKAGIKELVHIPVGKITLEGYLHIPEDAKGIVIFSHGSGSSHKSSRNNYVASVLHDYEIGTLLIDLLTKVEDENYERRFDIDLLTKRLTQITDWLIEQKDLKDLKIGLFGSSTGSASALRTVAKMGSLVSAVVSRGGRPDLALEVLHDIKAPVLLIVGGNDLPVLELNQEAYKHIDATKKLEIVPGAGHLFEEPEQLETVAELAAEWFEKYLK